MKMTKRLRLAVIASLVAVLFIGVFIAINRQVNKMMVYTGTPVSFSYPKNFSEAEKTSLSTGLESVVKFVASDPLFVIELYKEKGAIVGANVTRAPFLDYLDSVVVKNQKVLRKDYDQKSQTRIKISGYDASRLDYSYLAADGRTTLHVSFFNIPWGNDAYYLSIGSTDSKKLNQVTDKIQATIQLK